ncbi:MAG: hypothetical protein IPK05_16810 [Comamonadaceae bacterium]|nr:hypothetical protein [Comamonadaceae bacterium]
MDALAACPAWTRLTTPRSLAMRRVTIPTCAPCWSRWWALANRRAAMVSTLVAGRSADDPEPLIAVGRVVGEIAGEPVGNNGFGFGPRDVHSRVRADSCAIASSMR